MMDEELVSMSLVLLMVKGMGLESVDYVVDWMDKTLEKLQVAQWVKPLVAEMVVELATVSALAKDSSLVSSKVYILDLC